VTLSQNHMVFCSQVITGMTIAIYMLSILEAGGHGMIVTEGCAVMENEGLNRLSLAVTILILNA